MVSVSISRPFRAVPLLLLVTVSLIRAAIDAVSVWLMDGNDTWKGKQP